MTILFSKKIRRPSFNPSKLAALRQDEVFLLEQRAREIRELGLTPANPKVAALLEEECSLSERTPEGIQGWNCLGPTESPSMVIVGQNPYMMSYVQTASSVISGMSSADQRALWLGTGVALRLRGRGSFTRSQWTEEFFKTGQWRSLMKDVAVVNGHSYRYFVKLQGQLDLATSLGHGVKTLGSQDTIRALNEISEEILMTTLAQPSVRCAVVAQRAFAVTLQNNSHLRENGDDIRFVGCFHWNHPHAWKDFQTIIDEIL